MNDDYNNVECGIHGKAPATFVCQHLTEGKSRGFHVGFDPDDPDNLYPDAWCDRCNEVVDQEGEWNDRSEAFANIKLICANCYRAIREANWNEDEEALSQLIRSSFEYLQDAQSTFLEEYKVGDYERWDWYQETGKLVFSHAGQPVVECNVDFVGTLSTVSGTWMWAWANDSFTDNIKEESRRIRAVGDEAGFLKLASALWDADEADGWEMTAVMAKKLGAVGAYRTPSDNGFVYMVVRRARLVNGKPSNVVRLGTPH